MKHIPRIEPPAFAIAGCIGVGQKATCVPVNFHLVRKKRIQAVDLVSASADYSMIIEVDTSCSMSITGNGKILIGEGYDWSDEEAEGKDEVPIRTVIGSPKHTQEEALADIRRFEGNVVVSYDQVKVADGYPQIRSYCYYTSDPTDPYLTENIIDPATGTPYRIDTSYVVKKLRPGKGAMTEPILRSTSELGEGALFRPLLVATEGDQCYLRSEIVEERTGSSIEYEIHMVDGADQQIMLSGKSALYLPYPEGMDMESAADYEVTIHHDAAGGEEIYSTADDTIELTPYGFCIRVSSLSPFEVSWRSPEAVHLPQTGDHVYPERYALLLMMLSLAALIALSRKMKKA